MNTDKQLNLTESISSIPVMNKSDYKPETKQDRVYNDADVWKAVILDCDGEIKKDEENNQDVAYKGESVIGIFDFDLEAGMVTEDEDEDKTFDNQEEWLKSVKPEGSGDDSITLDQDDDGAVIVAKDKDGNVLGSFTNIDGKGKGVKVSEGRVGYNVLISKYAKGNENFSLFQDGNYHYSLLKAVQGKEGQFDTVKEFDDVTAIEVETKLVQLGYSKKTKTESVVYLGHDRATWVDGRENIDAVGLFTPGEAKQLASQMGGFAHEAMGSLADASGSYVVTKEVLKDDGDQGAGADLQTMDQEAGTPVAESYSTMTASLAAARKYAESKGYEIDSDEWFIQVNSGPAKPTAGKTNNYKVALLKNGKVTNHMLCAQVYGMGNGNYEVNFYIS